MIKVDQFKNEINAFYAFKRINVPVSHLTQYSSDHLQDYPNDFQNLLAHGTILFVRRWKQLATRSLRLLLKICNMLVCS